MKYFDYTDKFIELLLSEPAEESPRSTDYHILKDTLKHLSPSRIHEYVAQMKYSDFLQTSYWKTIAEYTKYKALYRCAFCVNQKDLHVHHLNYRFLGLELWDRKDLIVLCASCHKKQHWEKQNWGDILRELNLIASTAALATHCVLKEIKDDRLTLILAKKHAPMLQPIHSKRLTKAISELFNKEIKVRIDISQD